MSFVAYVYVCGCVHACDMTVIHSTITSNVQHCGERHIFQTISSFTVQKNKILICVYIIITFTESRSDVVFIQPLVFPPSPSLSFPLSGSWPRDWRCPSGPDSGSWSNGGSKRHWICNS